MFDVILHSTHDHPNLWWVVVPSLLSLLAGIGIGHRTRVDRLREWASSRSTGDE